MSNRIHLTVLVENSVHGRGLRAEHGWSVHLRNGSAALLFDTGQSGLLRHNADQMGIDLSRVDAVALSHGHYDHTGGLTALWEAAPRARVFLHPAALGPHYSRNPDGTARDVGIAEAERSALRQRPGQIVEVTRQTEVQPGFFLTGSIPRQTDFEDVGGPFVLDPEGLEPDPIPDDQALYFDTSEGVVVVLGCAHAGVVNTLRHIRGLTGERPFHTVLGGMHLLAASDVRIERTFDAFRELGIPRLGPGHCTGMRPAARLWAQFGEACFACNTGTRLMFHAR